MKLWRSPRMLLVGMLWLLSASQGSAQVPHDYEENPRRDDVVPHFTTSPEETLRLRLGISRDLDATAKLLRSLARDPKSLSGISNDQFQKLRDTLSKQPELEKFARGLMDKPEFREQLKKGLDLKNLTGEQKTVLRKEVEKLLSKDTAPKPMDKDASSVSAPSPASGAATEPGQQQDRDKVNQYLSQKVEKIAEAFNKVGDKKDASFLRNLAQNIASSGSWNSPGYDGPLARALRRVGAALQKLPLDRLHVGDWSGVFGNLSFPDLPWPSFLSDGGPSMPDFAESRWSFQDSSGKGKSMVLFLWGILMLLLLFLWKGKHLLGVPVGAGSAPWRLGPWPVSPEQVRSRGDLVKAFEYLAFLLLGRAAQPRNHLDLAADLAAKADGHADRRDAAARLARLYERARYAPEQDTLPETDLQAAREDLAFLGKQLAGVAPA